MKLKYIISSALITALFLPALLFVPIVGAIGIFMYTMPLGLIGGLLGSTQQFVRSELFVIVPSGTGWLIIIPFWLIVGGLFGYLTYTIRRSYYIRKDLSISPSISAGLLFAILLQLLLIFAIQQIMRPFVERDRKAAAEIQQKYYDDNCKTVYTQRSHYKILECPNMIVGSNPAQVEYFSEKGQLNNR